MPCPFFPKPVPRINPNCSKYLDPNPFVADSHSPIGFEDEDEDADEDADADKDEKCVGTSSSLSSPREMNEGPKPVLKHGRTGMTRLLEWGMVAYFLVSFKAFNLENRGSPGCL